MNGGPQRTIFELGHLDFRIADNPPKKTIKQFVVSVMAIFQQELRPLGSTKLAARNSDSNVPSRVRRRR
jgi:hypothetical protein